ncbi:MAG: twitch domain-containing radical SAM protein [Fischerella sp.]|nr:twitch domain-containing radical SAM protein [Fischerella sp.]
MKNKHPIISIQNKINNVSPTFCIAKWKQVTLHLHNGHNHSCHHPRIHKIPLEEITNNVSSLHNTSYKKQQRKMMLEGIRPEECHYCWSIEDLPNYNNNDFFSDRITKSSNLWAFPYLNEIVNSPWDANINPSYVEVSFSNLCNFKCSYCSPVFSSKWVEEAERYGPYPTSTSFNDIGYYKSVNQLPIHHTEHNPYVEAFWQWWPDLVKDLKVFRITGGEPLLNENTYKVMEYLYDNPQPELEFAVNTNGCVPDKFFTSFIDLLKKLLDENKIKSAKVFTSVDSWGKYAEYGRHGLNFTEWRNNIETLLSKIPRLGVTIMCTMNIFSTVEFKKLLEIVLYMKTNYKNNLFDIDTPILKYPSHQCLNILTEEHLNCFDDALEFMKQHNEFINFEVTRLQRVVEFVKTSNLDVEEKNLYRSDFYTFVNEHDRRRGTNFLETFPELKNFYDVCRDSFERRTNERQA